MWAWAIQTVKPAYCLEGAQLQTLDPEKDTHLHIQPTPSNNGHGPSRRSSGDRQYRHPLFFGGTCDECLMSERAGFLSGKVVSPLTVARAPC